MKRTIFVAFLLVAFTIFNATLPTSVYALETSTSEKTINSDCIFQDVLSMKKTDNCLITIVKDKDQAKNITFFSSVSELQTPVLPSPSPTAKPVYTYVSTLKTLSDSYSKQATLSADLLFDMVNDYRKQLHLTPFEKSQQLCDIAVQRAGELPNELFVTGKLHSGFYGRNLPYWAVENLIYAKSEQQALTWWLNSPIHRQTIVGDFKYSCSACQNEGCSQIFTSFVPKLRKSS